MSSARVEFLIEPFVIDSPGPHVTAAVSAATDAGLEPDMGPFATSATGDLDTILDMVSHLLRATFDNGATSVQLQIDTSDLIGRPGLHDALDRMIADVEREIGTAITEMTRAQKQQAVARLDTHGAFLLRGSAESIANTMQISKVTLYAYLNAVTRD